MSDFRRTQKHIKNLQKARAGWSDFIEEFLLKMALDCMGKTKKLTPVDDGDLRNSWKVSDVTRDGEYLLVSIFNDMEYASYVEYGHWQRKRFLPIKYLDMGSKKGKQLAADIRAKYGAGTEGVMLQNKWIPGYFMATIPFNQVRQQMPAKYHTAFINYMRQMGVI